MLGSQALSERVWPTGPRGWGASHPRHSQIAEQRMIDGARRRNLRSLNRVIRLPDHTNRDFVGGAEPVRVIKLLIDVLEHSIIARVLTGGGRRRIRSGAGRVLRSGRRRLREYLVAQQRKPQRQQRARQTEAYGRIHQLTSIHNSFERRPLQREKRPKSTIRTVSSRISASSIGD